MSRCTTILRYLDDLGTLLGDIEGKGSPTRYTFDFSLIDLDAHKHSRGVSDCYCCFRHDSIWAVKVFRDGEPENLCAVWRLCADCKGIFSTCDRVIDSEKHSIRLGICIASLEPKLSPGVVTCDVCDLEDYEIYIAEHENVTYYSCGTCYARARATVDELALQETRAMKDKIMLCTPCVANRDIWTHVYNIWAENADFYWLAAEGMRCA